VDPTQPNPTHGSTQPMDNSETVLHKLELHRNDRTDRAGFGIEDYAERVFAL